jgi:hypothetical protein
MLYIYERANGHKMLIVELHGKRIIGRPRHQQKDLRGTDLEDVN